VRNIRPLIHAACTPLDGCKRCDKITLGCPSSSTQNRRLIAHSICKAADIVYIHLFKKKMQGRGRLAHISIKKIRDHLITMCKHVFIWFGCSDSRYVYRIPVFVNEASDAVSRQKYPYPHPDPQLQ
jgi:hypothetical protein